MAAPGLPSFFVGGVPCFVFGVPPSKAALVIVTDIFGFQAEAAHAVAARLAAASGATGECLDA
jgi:hypothetical protein